MPIPLIPAIMAGGQIVSQGLNAIGTSIANKKSRKWQEMMYQRQREHSLADWNMMNKYNSPEEQMKRFKQAGLNPNLIYGQTNEGATMRSSSAGSYTARPMEFDVGGAFQSGLDAYYDIRIKEAQIDNLQAQQEVLTQTSLEKAANVILRGISGKRIEQLTKEDQFDLALKNELKDISVAVAEAGLNRVRAQTQFTLSENERREAMLAPNMAVAFERIATMRAQQLKDKAAVDKMMQEIENMKKDGRLKQLEINWREMGLTSKDPLWQRRAAQLLNVLFKSGDGSGGMPNIQKRVISTGSGKRLGQMGAKY